MPACEWGLDRFDPDLHYRPFGWAWLDRWAFRTAYRQNARLFVALAGQDMATIRIAFARVVVAVLAVLLFLAWLGLFGLAGWLIGSDFPSLRMVPGVVLVLLGLAMRPRFGKADPLVEPLTRAEAPTLLALVDRVAAAVGITAPQVVAVDRRLTASAGTVGVRRRRVLTLGLPLWLLLSPQQRVALLAHELGHFGNRDPRRRVLIQPALLTFGVLAEVTRPNPDDLENASGLAWLGQLFAHVVMSLVSNVFLAVHLVLLWLARRDGQRAEYLADAWAAAVAGSRAGRELQDALLTLFPVGRMLSRAARQSGEVADWRAAVDASRQRLAPELPRWQQLSVSAQASLFATHPPVGLRRRMAERQPPQDPTVVLTEAEAERIDAELAPRYVRMRRSLGALGDELNPRGK